MRIEFLLSIGYIRRRAGMTDRWESRFTTAGLLVVGAIVALVILVFLVPRILGWLGFNTSY